MSGERLPKVRRRPAKLGHKVEFNVVNWRARRCLLGSPSCEKVRARGPVASRQTGSQAFSGKQTQEPDRAV